MYLTKPRIQQLDFVEGFHSLTGLKGSKQTGTRPPVDPTAWVLKQAAQPQGLDLGQGRAEQQAGSWAFPQAETGQSSSGESEKGNSVVLSTFLLHQVRKLPFSAFFLVTN